MAATPNPPICNTTMSILSAHLEIQQHGQIRRDAMGIIKARAMGSICVEHGQMISGHQVGTVHMWHELPMAAKLNPPMPSTTVSIMSAHLEMQQHGQIRRDAMGIIKARPMGSICVEHGQMISGHQVGTVHMWHELPMAAKLHKIHQCLAQRCQLCQLIWKCSSMGNQTGCNGDNQSRTNGMHMWNMVKRR